jgi:hypothetical protein
MKKFDEIPDFNFQRCLLKTWKVVQVDIVISCLLCENPFDERQQMAAVKNSADLSFFLHSGDTFADVSSDRTFLAFSELIADISNANIHPCQSTPLLFLS